MNFWYSEGKDKMVTAARKKYNATIRITKRMIECYKLRHHAFTGLSSKETATVMGVSVRQVNRLMADMEQLASQLFPVLTREQAGLWSQWFDEGLTCYQIAEKAGATERTIQARLLVIKKMMNYNEKTQVQKTLSIDAGIDESKIKQRF